MESSFIGEIIVPLSAPLAVRNSDTVEKDSDIVGWFPLVDPKDPASKRGEIKLGIRFINAEVLTDRTHQTPKVLQRQNAHHLEAFAKLQSPSKSSSFCDSASTSCSSDDEVSPDALMPHKKLASQEQLMAQWMWDEKGLMDFAGMGKRNNPMRWSALKRLGEMCEELQVYEESHSDRPVLVRVVGMNGISKDIQFENAHFAVLHLEHLDCIPLARWMWPHTSIAGSLGFAERNPLRWSERRFLHEVIAEMEAFQEGWKDFAVRVEIVGTGDDDDTVDYDNARSAIEALQKLVIRHASSI